MTPEFAVIGRGLWGTAAAMYLAQAGCSVALIGPSEPADKMDANGPFASHYDAGRITRSIDRKVFWARAAARSIARHDRLIAETGLDFYWPCGGMIAFDNAPDFAEARAIAKAERFAHETYSDTTLPDRFGMFSFAQDTHALWDPTGGTINPRLMRQAHEIMAVRAGARIVDDVAERLNGASVTLRSGTRIDAGHVLVATGGYAGISDLLPAQPEMQTFARTVFFAEVDEDQAARLSGMPSLIWRPPHHHDYLYLLPPLRYPDGRLLIKIGGDPEDKLLSSESEATAWFQGSGDPDVAAFLEAALVRLMPELAIKSSHAEPCLLAYSSTGHPLIGQINDELTLATACCGAGAKSADELGRLAANAAMGHPAAASDLGADLSPRFN